jgi:monoamine oxidase
MDRREFLKGAAVLGTAAMLPGCRGSGSTQAGGPRIAIVGAGIAGLSAAHHLAKAGIKAEIYEAGHRPGGRIMTLKDVMGPGLWTEAGGEFIDSTHADLLGLAREMGLPLSDMQGEAYAAYRPTAWRFGGRNRSEAEVLAEVKLAAKRLQGDIDALPEEIAAGTAGAAEELDHLSLEEYLERRGVTGWFGDLLATAYATEFGLDAGEQSCLNLLTMVDLDASHGEFRVYGDSDERYRVEGGNQQITDALARKYESDLRYGHRLEALDGGSGGYRLHFQGPSGAVEKRADAVILALPFTLLRAVDLRLELPPGKRRAIAELGMGTNAKLFVGYKERTWRKNGWLGGFHTDGAVQGGWDHTQTQAGDACGLTVFQGGRAGVELGAGTPLSRADAFADELEALFPGSRAARNGRVGAFHWPTYPLSLGSYSCYRTGQWTGIGGEEGRSVGDLHFAGEHCSAEFQGYMNGGAETGRLAAEAILRKARPLRG